MRAQDCTATTMQLLQGPQRPAQIPDSTPPLLGWLNAVIRPPPPRPQPIATQTSQPIRALRFFWRSACCPGDGLDRSKRGGVRNSVTDALSLAFPSTVYPGLGSIGELVLTLGAGPLKLTWGY